MQMDALRLVLLDLCWFENGGAATKSRRTGNHLHGGFTPPFAVAYLSAVRRRISQGETMPSPVTTDIESRDWPASSHIGGVSVPILQ